MLQFFHRIRAYVLEHYIISGAAALVVVLVVWRVVGSGGNSSHQTLVVHPKTFAQQISVSGTVQAAQEVDLGFAASGRIAHTYASVGDVVREGAPIAEIENGNERAAVTQKQAALQAAQAQLASLQAGTRPEQIAITQSEIDSDKAALAQANQAVVNAIQNAYTQSDDAIHNKVDQFISNARSQTPQLTFTTSDAQLSNTVQSERVAIEATLTTWQSHLVALSASADLSAPASEAQANLAAVSHLLSDANAVLNAAIPTTSTTQSTINGYMTTVGTARANVNTAQTTLTSAITSRQNAAAALDKDQKNLALQQAGSTPQDLAAQQAQVAVAQANLQSAQSDLAKTIVSAPFSGTVTKMDAKVGEIVSPTVSEISMISTGLFQIKTYIPEVDIMGLQVGNSASTTLDAYGSNMTFAAKVIAIDPAETTVNGVSTYKTTLQFLTPDDRIKSGMTANTVITLKSVPNALVVPQGAIFQKNGQQTLQIEKDKSVVDVPVQVAGAASLGNIQVISGLSDGDVVILNPDTTK